MPVKTFLYKPNSNITRWNLAGNEESTARHHAEIRVLQHVAATDLLLLFVQNAFPCEDCARYLTNLTKSTTQGKGRKQVTIPGKSIIVRILDNHGGYGAAGTGTIWYFNGASDDERPGGFPPIPANYPQDMDFG